MVSKSACHVGGPQFNSLTPYPGGGGFSLRNSDEENGNVGEIFLIRVRSHKKNKIVWGHISCYETETKKGKNECLVGLKLGSTAISVLV